MKKTYNHLFFVIIIGLFFLTGISSIRLLTDSDQTEDSPDIANTPEDFQTNGSFLGVSMMEYLYMELSVTAEESFAVSDNVQKEEKYLTYDYWTDFSEDRNLPYADAETIEFIKKVYAEVDFRGEFKKGNPEVYDEYLESFQRLLQCKVPFRDKGTDEEIYITELEGFRDEYDVSKYKYYFFDANEDGFPDLGVRSDRGETYIFTYNQDDGKYSLWYSMESFWYLPLGSRKVIWPWDGRYLAFYQLDKEGNEELETFFMERHLSKEDSIYAVMIPRYAEKERAIEVPEEMKANGIYERSSENWYFRVTEEQYGELCQPYLEAYDAAEEEKKEVIYTYEELFE